VERKHFDLDRVGRGLQAHGHDAKLIPTQFVRAFVKSNKSDFLDAEAIAEAVDRQNMASAPPSETHPEDTPWCQLAENGDFGNYDLPSNSNLPQT
jgi:hypothetical protein